jgi:hypothetical protein
MLPLNRWEAQPAGSVRPARYPGQVDKPVVGIMAHRLELPGQAGAGDQDPSFGGQLGPLARRVGVPGHTAANPELAVARAPSGGDGADGNREANLGSVGGGRQE